MKPLFTWLLCLVAASAGTNEYRAAADYLESKNGHAMLVYEDGRLVFEAYMNDWRPEAGHRLASGTKSFAGALLAAAVGDGICRLDEPLSGTLEEWKDHRILSRVTVGELLSLNSGIAGGEIGFVPSYAGALDQVKVLERRRFSYGPVPFQLFGEFLRRKLGEKETVEQYLYRRILDPIGCKPTLWRKDGAGAGQPRLPSGAMFSAREWAKFGLLMVNRGEWQGKQVLDPALLKKVCWTGSKESNRYGRGFWLNTNPKFPADLVMAAGMGKQKLYIVPSRKLLVVQFAEARGFQEDAFLGKLFGKAEPGAADRPGLALLFKRWDKDGDGVLKGNELPRPDRLEVIDVNRDGAASLEEVQAWWRTRRGAGGGR